MDLRILITGANGFVGRRLCSLLLDQGHHVIGMTHSSSTVTVSEALQCDIRDAVSVKEAVRHAAPSHIIHLAAQCHVPTSFTDPHGTWQTNLMGSVNLLDALQRHAPAAFTLFVSSSEVYGSAFKKSRPVDEHDRCEPINPYAASKLAAEIAFKDYFGRGMRGVIARPFNHIGPGQSADYATASFAQQIARIEAGLQPPRLKVGNLKATRDFLDVRDVCDAYLALIGLAEREDKYPRCFNVASGNPRPIESVLETLLSLSNVHIEVEPDPQRMRPSDIPYAAGDCAALMAETGWRPRQNLKDTLSSVLNYWRMSTDV
ncbi:GDP-mannose 4,6-dehydratase [Stutzerimonas stutzeri]|uniref:GDP-mannose 4,6-dehydratase n=1 Tax=Stutzerimonas stutzeri TaxID=316 RepID=UPI0018A9DBB2|nr:GDP-mannose 4,6-dehydratase [Stutzerimonas stutzeri]QPI09197.1 GDP-mannose 4,6-dehydratase [Stutzerimonas stutzeri]UUC83131.1 GDP-mannose 4,6-dehydratase [Stutzerimonas stutzeri]